MGKSLGMITGAIIMINKLLLYRLAKVLGHKEARKQLQIVHDELLGHKEGLFVYDPDCSHIGMFCTWEITPQGHCYWAKQFDAYNHLELPN